jgi:MFS family permease
MPRLQLPPTRFLALQHPDFRYFWLCQGLATAGVQMQTIAANWHVYTLLRGASSSFSLFGTVINLDSGALGLGLLGLVRVLPLIVFGLLGGVLADRFNRRYILIGAQLAGGLFAVGLAAITVTGLATVPAIYLLIAAGSAATAVEAPARESLIPNLVPIAHLTNAISLDSFLRVVGTVVGPVLAGLLIDRTGVGPVYLLHGLLYGAVVLILLRIRHRPRSVRHSTISWQALVEGFRFTYQTRIIWQTLIIDFWATLLGSARTMLPIVAEEILKVGAGGYGLLATAQPVGSILAGSILSVRREIRQQGLVLLASIAIYGLGTALFGISTFFALSYLLFGFSGAADTVSSIIRGTIRQALTPDHLRGRMVGANMLFFMGGPQLGEVRAGLVAAVLGAPFAIISGGLAAALLALWAGWRYPRLRQYTSDQARAQPAPEQPVPTLPGY